MLRNLKAISIMRRDRALADLRDASRALEEARSALSSFDNDACAGLDAKIPAAIWSAHSRWRNERRARLNGILALRIARWLDAKRVGAHAHGRAEAVERLVAREALRARRATDNHGAAADSE